MMPKPRRPRGKSHRERPPRHVRESVVPAPEALIDSAFRRGGRAEIHGHGGVARGQRLASSKVDVVAHYLRDRLREIAIAARTEGLGESQAELVSIAVPPERFARSRARIEGAAGIIENLKRRHAQRIARSPRAESRRIREEFYGRVASVLKGLRADLADARAVALTLRRAEAIDPGMPTIVIAGFPNTGKSTLLARLTRAKPEVAPYPFTTQWVHVGHREFDGRRVQLVDTPGLLDRPLAERNEAERRAIAALRHCAHVTLFLVDQTGFAGPRDAQISLLEELRRLFPGTRVIEANSRADEVAPEKRTGDLWVSGRTGEGIEHLLDILSSEVTAWRAEAAAKLPPGPAES